MVAKEPHHQPIHCHADAKSLAAYVAAVKYSSAFTCLVEEVSDLKNSRPPIFPAILGGNDGAGTPKQLEVIWLEKAA